MEIQDKVAIITGASSGIGLATARLFAEKGARVVLAARSKETIEELSRELPGSLAIPTDMRDEAAVRNLISMTALHFGRLDILVNNAGQAMHVPVHKADPAMYRDLLELNVVSIIVAMSEAVKVMQQQGSGCIINISSGLSKRIVPGVGPYASTKYALNALTLTARIELAPENIVVSLVIPGLTTTNFVRNAAIYDLPANRPPTTAIETPEQVAEKILEAVISGEAEVYTENVRPAAQQAGAPVA